MKRVSKIIKGKLHVGLAYYSYRNNIYGEWIYPEWGIVNKWKYHDEKPIEKLLRFHQIFVDRKATMEHMLLSPDLWTYDNFMEDRYGFRLYTKSNWWKKTKKSVVMTEQHPLWKEKENE